MSNSTESMRSASADRRNRTVHGLLVKIRLSPTSFTAIHLRNSSNGSPYSDATSSAFRWTRKSFASSSRGIGKVVTAQHLARQLTDERADLDPRQQRDDLAQHLRRPATRLGLPSSLLRERFREARRESLEQPPPCSQRLPHPPGAGERCSSAPALRPAGGCSRRDTARPCARPRPSRSRRVARGWDSGPPSAADAPRPPAGRAPGSPGRNRTSGASAALGTGGCPRRTRRSPIHCRVHRSVYRSCEARLPSAHGNRTENRPHRGRHRRLRLHRRPGDRFAARRRPGRAGPRLRCHPPSGRGERTASTSSTRSTSGTSISRPASRMSTCSIHLAFVMDPIKDEAEMRDINVNGTPERLPSGRQSRASRR